MRIDFNSWVAISRAVVRAMIPMLVLQYRLARRRGQGDRDRAYAETGGGLYRARGSKLKNGKGFSKPNFGVGPNN